MLIHNIRKFMVTLTWVVPDVDSYRGTDLADTSVPWDCKEKPFYTGLDWMKVMDYNSKSMDLYDYYSHY